MSDDLARQFIAKLRAHGHRPYVEKSGRFGILLSVDPPTEPPELHHLGDGYSYTFGFDDRPFAALATHPDYVAKLIEATREAADFKAHVAGLDR